MAAAALLKQRVNFYISVSFIFVFGLFMTTTIVQAFYHNESDLKYLTASAVLGQ